MGLEDYLLAATLNGILAQRLVRRLCPDCSVPVEATPELMEQYGLMRYAAGGAVVLREPQGCAKCRGTGFIGRVAIAELLAVDEAVRSLILSRADHATIQSAACAAGMQAMYESGLVQVAAGTTSLGEILRAVRLEG